MSISKKLDALTNGVYKKVRAVAKRYYLKKTAKRDLDPRGARLTAAQKKEIRAFYAPFFTPDLIYHELYLQLTGRFDVRFLPDDVFSNVVDRYYNDGRRAVILENKCYFDRMFEGIPLPETLASRVNGFWSSPASGQVPFDTIVGELEGRGAVIKQAWGSSGGHSVVFQEHCTEEALQKAVRGISEDIIIQKPVEQHEVLAGINATSVNTVRVLSLLTRDGVKILSCFLRCGRAGAHVDNTSSGGFACGIDPDGRLRKYAYTRNDYTNAVTEHPDSHVVFEGLYIPSWDKMIDMVRRAHPQSPHFRMVSWDIAVNREGDPVLIEANLNGGVNRTHQILNGPVFGDDTERVLREVYGR